VGNEPLENIKEMEKSWLMVEIWKLREKNWEDPFSLGHMLRIQK
jgi:hypothetical protein